MQYDVLGLSPINDVLASVPNAYFSLHQGVSGTAPTTIPDSNTANGWALTPATVTTGQWTGEPGYWEGEAANTTDSFSLARTVDPALFDSIFNIKGNYSIWAAYCKSIGDPSAAGRIMTMGHSNPDQLSIIEMKFLTTGIAQVLLTGGSSEVANFLDLPAQAAPNEMIAICVIDDYSTKTMNTYSYFPGTKTLMTTAISTSIAGLTLGAPPSHESFYVGAKEASGTTISQLQNMDIRRIRVINFSQSPPTDVGEFIEELVVTRLTGTRR